MHTPLALFPFTLVVIIFVIGDSFPSSVNTQESPIEKDALFDFPLPPSPLRNVQGRDNNPGEVGHVPVHISSK